MFWKNEGMFVCCHTNYHHTYIKSQITFNCKTTSVFSSLTMYFKIWHFITSFVSWTTKYFSVAIQEYSLVSIERIVSFRLKPKLTERVGVNTLNWTLSFLINFLFLNQFWPSKCDSNSVTRKVGAIIAQLGDFYFKKSPNKKIE